MHRKTLSSLSFKRDNCSLPNLDPMRDEMVKMNEQRSIIIYSMSRGIWKKFDLLLLVHSRRTYWFSDQLDSTLEMRLQLALTRLSDRRTSAKFLAIFFSRRQTKDLMVMANRRIAKGAERSRYSAKCTISRKREREKGGEKKRKRPEVSVNYTHRIILRT